MIGILKFYFTNGKVVEMFINESSPMAEDVINEWITEYEGHDTFDYFEYISSDER